MDEPGEPETSGGERKRGKHVCSDCGWDTWSPSKLAKHRFSKCSWKG